MLIGAKLQLLLTFLISSASPPLGTVLAQNTTLKKEAVQMLSIWSEECKRTMWFQKGASFQKKKNNM